MARRLWMAVVIMLIYGCQQLPSTSGGVRSSGSSKPVAMQASAPAQRAAQFAIRKLNLVSLPQGIAAEHQDRVNRLFRLAKQFGAPAPQIREDLQVDGKLIGLPYDVPALRLTYPERLLFDFDKATVKDEFRPMLHVLAESMKRDLPDVHLLIVGHTDWVGTLAYNQRLSERRARAVMAALAELGVPTRQMSSIGMSERQPIASNATARGRALNRRVEFIISSSRKANIEIVRRREIDLSLLDPRDFNIKTPSNNVVLHQRIQGLTAHDLSARISVDGQRVSVDSLSREVTEVSPGKKGSISLAYKDRRESIVLAPQRIINITLKNEE